MNVNPAGTMRLIREGRVEQAIAPALAGGAAPLELLDVLDRATEEHPELGALFLARGHLLFHMGRINAALDEFFHASELDPDDPEALRHCAKCQVKLGLFSDAAEVLGELAEVEQDDDEAWMAFGDAAFAAGDFVRAAAAYDEAVQGGSAGPDALVGRAKAALALELHEDALEDLKTATGLRDDAEWWELLGIAQYDVGNDRDALGSFDRALALDDARPESHRGRGDALWMIGDLPAATEAYRRALAVAPDDVETLLGLAELLLEVRQADEAYATAVAALRHMAPEFHARVIGAGNGLSEGAAGAEGEDEWPEAAEAVRLVARARLELGDAEGARTLLDAAIEEAADQWGLYLERARAYKALRLRTLAKRDLDWAAQGDETLEEAGDLDLDDD